MTNEPSQERLDYEDEFMRDATDEAIYRIKENPSKYELDQGDIDGESISYDSRILDEACDILLEWIKRDGIK